LKETISIATIASCALHIVCSYILTFGNIIVECPRIGFLFLSKRERCTVLRIMICFRGLVVIMNPTRNENTTADDAMMVEF